MEFLILNGSRIFLVTIMRAFLVDCLMYLNISLIALKILKPLSGSILINLQPSSCSIAFCLFILYSIFLSLCPFSSISIASFYSHENTSQSYNLKNIVFDYFF